MKRSKRFMIMDDPSKELLGLDHHQLLGLHVVVLPAKNHREKLSRKKVADPSSDVPRRETRLKGHDSVSSSQANLRPLGSYGERVHYGAKKNSEMDVDIW